MHTYTHKYTHACVLARTRYTFTYLHLSFNPNSFESMSAEMPSDQWSMSSPGAANRDWNASNVITSFFGKDAAVAMGRYGEGAFKTQLYQSMIGQALFLKTEIEAWRSQNLWGSTIWMLVWPPAFMPATPTYCI